GLRTWGSAGAAKRALPVCAPRTFQGRPSHRAVNRGCGTRSADRSRPGPIDGRAAPTRRRIESADLPLLPGTVGVTGERKARTPARSGVKFMGSAVDVAKRGRPRRRREAFATAGQQYTRG